MELTDKEKNLILELLAQVKIDILAPNAVEYVATAQAISEKLRGK